MIRRGVVIKPKWGLIKIADDFEIWIWRGNFKRRRVKFKYLLELSFWDKIAVVLSFPLEVWGYFDEDNNA